MLQDELEHVLQAQLGANLKRRHPGERVEAAERRLSVRVCTRGHATPRPEARVGKLDEEVIHRAQASSSDGVQREESGERARVGLVVEADDAVQLRCDKRLHQRLFKAETRHV